MRILILTNKMPFPAKDGGSIATLSLAKNLQLCGAEIDILAMNTSKHNTRYEDIPVQLRQQIHFYPVEINSDIRLWKACTNFFFSSLPYNATRFISTDYKNELIKLLQSNTYEVIQLEGLYLCPYIATIRQYSKAKIALRSHNIEHEIWMRIVKQTRNPLKKIYLLNLAKRIKKFELRYFNDYDLLLPITERDGAIYADMGCTTPQYVVPTGADADDPLFNIDNQSVLFPSIFYFGALDWLPNQEGLEWFIEHVWDRFYKRYPACFSVAGRNAPAHFVRYLQEHNINYIGEVDDALTVYQHQSIMVVPLLSGSGMRIKIIEGMAAGKAIITSTIGTEGIPTTHGENIFIADDADDFYNHLEQLYTDFHLYLKISNSARNFVMQKFNNHLIAQNLLTFYTNHAS